MVECKSSTCFLIQGIKDPYFTVAESMLFILMVTLSSPIAR